MLPGPRRFHLRSSTTWLTDEVWLVHDTTTWEDGQVDRRDLLATLVAEDRIRVTGAEMPGGSEIRLEPDGFTFSPYFLAVSVPHLPVSVVLRCHDACRLAPDGELVNTIDVRLLGLPLGRTVIRLRPE